ncbi:VPS4-associated protein 1 [Pilaira anomala]|nr:VPS4-associated protein 1 [Pilaira anomala]
MSNASPQRLQNLYIARLTTQERPCFVCNKFTGVVLTSADNSNTDWFYICRSHLGDFNFCSKLGSGPKPNNKTLETKKQALANRPVESDSVVDLVSSIGSAWKSWRTKKPDEDQETDKKDSDKKDAEDQKKDDTTTTITTAESSTSTPTTTSPPASPTSPQQPVRFIIQKDYFYLRQREYMKKIQKKEAKEKLKTLQFPEVPQTMPTLK